jgi:hypothetical protein
MEITERSTSRRAKDGKRLKAHSLINKIIESSE